MRPIHASLINQTSYPSFNDSRTENTDQSSRRSSPLRWRRQIAARALSSMQCTTAEIAPGSAVRGLANPPLRASTTAKPEFCIHAVTGTGRLREVLTEDRLIDALRGCSSADELMTLQRRLAEDTEAPPLFDWICNLLVSRRLSRGLAARLLSQLHRGCEKS